MFKAQVEYAPYFYLQIKASSGEGLREAGGAAVAVWAAAAGLSRSCCRALLPAAAGAATAAGIHVEPVWPAPPQLQMAVDTFPCTCLHQLQTALETIPPHLPASPPSPAAGRPGDGGGQLAAPQV